MSMRFGQEIQEVPWRVSSDTPLMPAEQFRGIQYLKAHYSHLAALLLALFLGIAVAAQTTPTQTFPERDKGTADGNVQHIYVMWALSYGLTQQAVAAAKKLSSLAGRSVSPGRILL